MTNNLNGKYSVWSGSGEAKFFNDGYASKGHEYFDVWSEEIATHYGEVFWTGMGPYSLPDHIVERFKGKVIAITGYEHDQVMVTPAGQPGVNPEADVSVPINWAYNHHYGIYLTGKHSEMQKVHVAPGDPMAHGATTRWVAVDKPSASSRAANADVPVSQFFSEGNGGESRKSYHGYPAGYAQLVDSVDAWHLTPMQIDTRNRDCGTQPQDVANCSAFIVPGPEPLQARYGRGAPEGSFYSGLLECPCTERWGGDPLFYPKAQTKIFEHGYASLTSGTCSDIGSDIASASDCFTAVSGISTNTTALANRSVSDPDLPPSCSVVVAADGSATAYFNSGGEAACSGSDKKAGQATTQVNVGLKLEVDGSDLFGLSDKGVYCKNVEADPLQRFPAKNGLSGLVAAMDSMKRCQNYCFGNNDCWGCSVNAVNGGAQDGIDCKDGACAWNALRSCPEQQLWPGVIPGDVAEKHREAGLVTIIATGPDDVWFGVGFNASFMMDSPYALILTASGVIEYKIGTCGSEAEHCPGDQLASSVTVISNEAINGIRTVKMSRPLQGATKDHYTFHPSTPALKFIAAVGQSPEFSYHSAHDAAEISLSSVGTASCVCDFGVSGKLCETGGVHCEEFTQNCYSKAQGGDLLELRNPTCTSEQYSGGLKCCDHGRILLDVEQAEESLQRELLRYHIKVRFWYQERTVDAASERASHQNLHRIYFQTEAQAGEYDVPPAFARPGLPIVGYPEWPEGEPTPGTKCTGSCPDGPDCDCEHEIVFRWASGEVYSGGPPRDIRLFYAGGHCHSPDCKSLNLYRNYTGELELICAQEPQYGKGNFADNRFDEAGYATIPPCLWSDDPKEGLSPSVWLPRGTPMVSIKRTRNTRAGHYGDMASWQMRGVTSDPSPEFLI